MTAAAVVLVTALAWGGAATIDGDAPCGAIGVDEARVHFSA